MWSVFKSLMRKGSERGRDVDGLDRAKKPKEDRVPVSSLIDIPVRARRCLRMLEIEFLDEIENFKAVDILSLRSMGRKTLKEVKAVAKRHGFELKDG